MAILECIDDLASCGRGTVGSWFPAIDTNHIATKVYLFGSKSTSQSLPSAVIHRRLSIAATAPGRASNANTCLGSILDSSAHGRRCSRPVDFRPGSIERSKSRFRLGSLTPLQTRWPLSRCQTCQTPPLDAARLVRLDRAFFNPTNRRSPLYRYCQSTGIEMRLLHRNSWNSMREPCNASTVPGFDGDARSSDEATLPIAGESKSCFTTSCTST